MMRIHHICVPHYRRVQERLFSSRTRIVAKENLPGVAYKPELVEKDKYDKWEKNGLFTAENNSDKPTFSMILPPPNVTGKLHLGHALACTVQDVIVRRKRSMGHNVLWLPGTDHAGIATQGVVEKYLQTTQNTNRHIIGRENFYNEVWKWREKHGNTIINQLKTLGCSLDWTRQVFTMDPKHTKAVNTAFIRLFKKGLIYRKKSLINWCNKLKSTVSDIEVDNIAINGPTDIKVPGYTKPVKFGLIYNFAYKIAGSDEEIVVSTTMPETMLGDTGIAVHPNDQRYTHLRDKIAVHPFRDTTIPIIFDDFVDMKFGTGAVKITPAHSKIDHDVAIKHNLPLLEVVNENGEMKNAGIFDGMKRYECRDELINKLDELGVLKEIKAHPMTLPVCSRTGDVIEHLPKEQWFLSCSELNKKTVELVKNNKLYIDPEKFVKNWYNWTKDDRDWCISRQLWWGHQIPAYRCSVGEDEIWIAAVDEDSAKVESSKFLKSMPDVISAERDTDVLDTWFSSGLYPFAALGWPKDTEDLKKFYPLNLMATGHDILGFWVHRMVMLGLELTDQLPFDNVLLHGIICDSKGAKMSKSKGNVIDPVDVINGITVEALKEKSEEMHRNGTLSKEELKKALNYHKSNFSHSKGIPECGVDALRFTLLTQDIKSHFVNFDVNQCHANAKFCNKIWQSIKYVDLSFAKLKKVDDINMEDLTYFDKWILSRLAEMVDIANRAMDTHDFHVATNAIKNFIYFELCDFYLEATKPGFDGDDPKMAFAHAHTLSVALHTSLRMLSPFMIYITEELIPKVPSFETNIIHNYNDANSKYLDYPKYFDFEIWRNSKLEADVDKFLGALNLVRELKGLYNISNKLRPSISIKTEDAKLMSDLKDYTKVVLNLTKCGAITFETEPDKKYVSGLLDKNTEINVQIIGENIEDTILAARQKLQIKTEKLENAVIKLEAKMSSHYYFSSTPQWTQVEDKENLLTRKKELKELQRLI